MDGVQIKLVANLITEKLNWIEVASQIVPVNHQQLSSI